MNSKSKLSLFRSILLLSLSSIFVTSCSENDDLSSKNTIELTVASSQATVEDKTLLIARPDNGSWTILNDDIKGFEYEEGYEYRLKVRVVTPPSESSKTASYELIKQLSRTKKATVFSSDAFSIRNNADAVGEKLTSDEITAIKDKIKQSSPFNGVTTLILDFIDFSVTGPFNRNFVYRTDAAKTGNGYITIEEIDGKAIQFFTFDFAGKSVRYKYVHGSPTSRKFLMMDLTSEYKADYPNLEEALSGIVLNVML